MASEWYINRSGVFYGPMPTSGLKWLARSGQLTAADYIWKKGMSHWKTASVVEGFAPGSQQSLPLPYPASNLPPPSSPRDSTCTATPGERQKKSISSRPIIVASSILGGVLLVVILWVSFSGSSSTAARNTNSDAEEQFASAKTPATGMTIAQFREAVNKFMEPVPTKSEFYAQFGHPVRVITQSETTLIYKCTDGSARVECKTTEFVEEKKVAVKSVGQ